MSLLQILAILGTVIGAAALISELKYKGQRSFGLIISLIIASILLFVSTMVASKKVDVQQSDSGRDVQALAVKQAPVPEPAVQNLAPNDADALPDQQEIPAPVPVAEIPEQPAPDAPVPEEPAAVPEAPVAEAPAQPAPAAAPAPDIKNDAAAPLANAGDAIDEVKINENVSFTGKKSKKNPDGAEIASYAWDFGDGNKAEGRDAKHAFAQAGEYDVTLTVTDKNGLAAKAVRHVSVSRPENKIRFVSRSLSNIDNSTGDGAVSGACTKVFSGSHLLVEASGYMLSADGCTCEIIVSLRGPGCNSTKTKSLKDGGEGDLSVKASCKSAPGDYTWTVERKSSGACGCTWTGVKIDGGEV